MKNILLMTLFTAVAYASDPVMELACASEKAAEVALEASVAAQPALTTTQDMIMQQMTMKNALTAFSFVQNPVPTAVGVAASKGMAAVHPIAQRWIGAALEGKKSALVARAIELKKEIASSFLPKTRQKAELATLTNIIESDVAKQMEVMRYGTPEQVLHSLYQMRDAIEANKRINSETPSEFNPKVVHGVLQENIYKVDPSLADMVLTSPSSSVGPGYLRSETLKQIQALDAVDLDVFITQATEIINKTAATTAQKKALLADTLLGRLIMRFSNNMGSKLKFNPIYNFFKKIIDWQYGSLYLTDLELEEWHEAAHDNLTTLVKAVQLDEPALNQLVDGFCEVLHSFIGNSKYRSLKRVTGKVAAVNEALDKI